jgi:hypothetical protein
MADEKTLKYWLQVLNEELDDRIPDLNRMEDYYEGEHAPPNHVRELKVESEWRVLTKQASTNWPALIVDSVEERMEVTGFRFGDTDQTDEDVWNIWQKNNLDADSALVHKAALSGIGRSYVIVWADEAGNAQIIPEHASTTVVAYDPQQPRRRLAGLRRWREGKFWYCTVYLPEGLFKFQTEHESSLPRGDNWVRREVPDEPWPLPNPLRVVPIVEVQVNRRLKPGMFGETEGEFETVIPICDRINTTIFAGMLAQAYAAWPVRALIGSPLQLDENGDPVAPFSLSVDRLVQIENPDAKLQQLPESDLSNYVRFAEMHIRHLAAVTKTPAHYLLGDTMANLSADAIRASEAGLISKVRRHMVTTGEAWEAVMRLALQVENPGDPRSLAVSAEVKWRDPESRSQAEQADAAVKLATILPWQAIAEKILGATPQEVAQWEAQKASDQLGALMSQPMELPEQQ